jgi:hypothetical protein
MFSVREKLCFFLELFLKQNAEDVGKVDTLLTAVNKIQCLVSSSFCLDVNIFKVLCIQNLMTDTLKMFVESLKKLPLEAI